MFLLFLITVHLNARIPEKLVFWTVSCTPTPSAIFGDVLGSPGQQELSSVK